jgi:hypothetical protein
MAEVRFARTASRSVLGTMNDFIFQMESEPARRSSRDLLRLAMLLNRTPVSPLKYMRPEDKARELLGIGRSRKESARTPGRARSTRAKPSIYELRISLREVEPEVWRSVLVRSDSSLSMLHRILQTVTGWTDSHLHQFQSADTVYGRPDPASPRTLDERKAVLAGLMRAPGDQLTYVYDLGDAWEHDIGLLHVFELEPTSKLPYVTGGERACPPEDCGGPAGYERLLKALSRPRHPDHRDLVEWVGGSFDPEVFDAEAVNRAFHGGRHVPASSADAGRSKIAFPLAPVPRLGRRPRRH